MYVCVCLSLYVSMCFSTEPGVSLRPHLVQPVQGLGPRPTASFPPLRCWSPVQGLGAVWEVGAGIWVGICVCVERPPPEKGQGVSLWDLGA